MTQEQTRSSRRGKPQEEVESQKIESAPPDTVTTDLLDEIDTVLEENAEEFVRAFTQKGGE